MEPWKEPDWLARQYGPAVYRLAFARTGSRADAEDVMQEVFVRLLKAKPDFSLKCSGVTVTQVQLSPLGAVVTYIGDEDALAAEALQVETAAGETPAWGGFSGWNWGGEGTAIWSFDEPVELENIVSITIGGESFPVAR